MTVVSVYHGFCLPHKRDQLLWLPPRFNPWTKVPRSLDAMVAHYNFLTTGGNPEKKISKFKLKANVVTQSRESEKQRNLKKHCKVCPLLWKTVHCIKRA